MMSQEDTIQLYHGTCSCKAELINKVGLKADSCLTDDTEIANYYADVAHDDCGCGDYTTLRVVAKKSELRVDYPSFEEPLSYYRNNYTTCDREWNELIESGEIPYPNDNADYQTSLDVTHCVRHTAEITASDINELD